MIIRSDPFSSLPGLAHGFFGRQGGVSEGIYASLNCGPGSKDNPEHIAENRRRIAAHFDTDPEALVTLAQIHSAEVVCAHRGLRGCEGDALITGQPGVILGVLAADCVPILLADATHRIIGAAHAGWKGALGNIMEATIAAMCKKGAKREAIQAAIGPCIAQASYEVSEDFLTPFLAKDPDNARFFQNGKPGKKHFDIRGYVALGLANAGIHRIDLLGNDTCAEADHFFSYRRATLRGEADYGRQVSCIMLR